MTKIENIVCIEKSECIKYTHFFDGGTYTHSTKEIVVNDEIGIQVKVARVPKTSDKWSYGVADYVGRIIEIYYFYETADSKPRKKYLIHFNHGDMICENYKEVYQE